MALTKTSYSMITGALVNVLDFGADPTGSIDSTTAIQAAITYSTSINKAVFLPGGTYKTNLTLTMSGNNSLIGEGKNDVKINYSGASSAILCSGWTGVISDLSIYITDKDAHGIQAGKASRQPVIRNVYLDATAVGSTTTGSGIYLVGDTGFSGGIGIENVYVLQFKFGVNIYGTNSATDCWTAISMTNVWLNGNSAGVVAGSCGIYMSANCNGHATTMNTGLIQSFDYGCYFDNGSEGASIHAHMESNNNYYFAGNTFNGAITNDTGGPRLKEFSQATTQIIKEVDTVTNVRVAEFRYPPVTLVYDASPGALKQIWYRAPSAISNTDGTYSAPSATYALKFAVGLGQSSAYGIATHPSDHYIQVSDRKLHWSTNSPAAETGSQIVAWVRGDVCYNAAAAVGAPIGWMCTVAGTPGTWVAMANL
jgi:hypothetical protein